MLVAVSHLYYAEGLKQEAVASRMNVSRLSASRVLKKARTQGFVQISVNRPLPMIMSPALDLEKRYGLKVARVVQTCGAPEETVGRVAPAMPRLARSARAYVF